MPSGGAREGAGRKSDGKIRKPICWKLSEDERIYLRKCLDSYRKENSQTIHKIEQKCPDITP